MTVDGHLLLLQSSIVGTLLYLIFWYNLLICNTPQVSFKHKWQSNRTTSLQAAASMFEKISIDIQLGTSDPSGF